jgi:hypothetical protein
VVAVLPRTLEKTSILSTAYIHGGFLKKKISIIKHYLIELQMGFYPEAVVLQ